MALRNLGDLLEGDWDIRYQPERGQAMEGKKFNAFLTEEELARAAGREGVNSGTLAVRGCHFHEVLRRWQAIKEGEPVRDSGFRDQVSWNALLLREEGKEKGFRIQVSEDSGRRAGVVTADAPAPGGTPGGTGATPVLPGVLAVPALKVEAFPVGEVQFPGYLDPAYQSYSKAAITHNILPDTKEKIEFTFGLYMRTFFCDPTGLFFSMLEM